jgi:cytochrome P450/NADPH-cytochrome P450 reductase
VLADSEYDLKIKQTLTIKPDNFFIHAIPRKDVPPMVVGTNLRKPTPANIPGTKGLPLGDAEGKQRLHVLYGSNTGTSEAFAQRIASAASGKGFNACISTLDAVSGHLSKNEPTVIVTASFEGQPADNAGRFVEDLSNLTGDELNGVSYALFGCGNRDWAITYQRIPRLIDETLEKHGAKRLLELGEGDAAGSDFFDAFDAWEEKLWKTLGEVNSSPCIVVVVLTTFIQTYDVEPTEGATEESFEVQVSGQGTERAISLRQPDAALGKVVENRVLTASTTQEKRHIGQY